MIKMIVAMTEDKLIGKDNNLPWHIPSELKHFNDTTKGHYVLFGKTTFVNLHNKLTDRKNIVLSSSDVSGADKTIHNEEELIELFKRFKNSKEILFIAGGKSIYEKYCEFADEWIISYIWGNYAGNVFIEIKPVNYEKIKVECRDGFDIVYYERI